MKVLLLAGSSEARQVADLLAQKSVPALASLAGVTRTPAALPLPTRIGGFGGAAGFVACLEAENIGAVIDATHPFAQEITNRSAEICQARGLPYLQVLRPEWQAGPGDDWHPVADELSAVALIAPRQVVFLATGRQTLARFSGLAGRRVLCRQIDPPEAPFPFAGGEFIVGRPPFSVAQEVALFRELEVDWLVVKNAGGVASRSKLDAARELSIPVAMIERAEQPDVARVETAEAALEWLAGLPE